MWAATLAVVLDHNVSNETQTEILSRRDHHRSRIACVSPLNADETTQSHMPNNEGLASYLAFLLHQGLALFRNHEHSIEVACGQCEVGNGRRAPTGNLHVLERREDDRQCSFLRRGAAFFRYPHFVDATR